MFTVVTFRLFDQQINGAIADDCTVMIHGIPFSDASNSERINAGLDIVRVLQKYENVTAPVFVDNAEAVTALIKMDCQTIRLVVSESDKSLRIVVEKESKTADKRDSLPDLTLSDFGNQIDFDSFLKG